MPTGGNYGNRPNHRSSLGDESGSVQQPTYVSFNPQNKMPHPSVVSNAAGENPARMARQHGHGRHDQQQQYKQNNMMVMMVNNSVPPPPSEGLPDMIDSGCAPSHLRSQDIHDGYSIHHKPIHSANQGKSPMYGSQPPMGVQDKMGMRNDKQSYQRSRQQPNSSRKYDASQQSSNMPFMHDEQSQLGESGIDRVSHSTNQRSGQYGDNSYQNMSHGGVVQLRNKMDYSHDVHETGARAAVNSSHQYKNNNDLNYMNMDHQHGGPASSSSRAESVSNEDQLSKRNTEMGGSMNNSYRQAYHNTDQSDMYNNGRQQSRQTGGVTSRNQMFGNHPRNNKQDMEMVQPSDGSSFGDVRGYRQDMDDRNSNNNRNNNKSSRQPGSMSHDKSNRRTDSDRYDMDVMRNNNKSGFGNNEQPATRGVPQDSQCDVSCDESINDLLTNTRSQHDAQMASDPTKWMRTNRRKSSIGNQQQQQQTEYYSIPEEDSAAQSPDVMRQDGAAPTYMLYQNPGRGPEGVSGYSAGEGKMVLCGIQDDGNMKMNLTDTSSGFRSHRTSIPYGEQISMVAPMDNNTSSQYRRHLGNFGGNSSSSAMTDGGHSTGGYTPSDYSAVVPHLLEDKAAYTAGHETTWVHHDGKSSVGAPTVVTSPQGQIVYPGMRSTDDTRQYYIHNPSNNRFPPMATSGFMNNPNDNSMRNNAVHLVVLPSGIHAANQAMAPGPWGFPNAGPSQHMVMFVPGGPANPTMVNSDINGNSATYEQCYEQQQSRAPTTAMGGPNGAPTNGGIHCPPIHTLAPHRYADIPRTTNPHAFAVSDTAFTGGTPIADMGGVPSANMMPNNGVPAYYNMGIVPTYPYQANPVVFPANIVPIHHSEIHTNAVVGNAVLMPTEDSSSAAAPAMQETSEMMDQDSDPNNHSLLHSVRWNTVSKCIESLLTSGHIVVMDTDFMKSNLESLARNPNGQDPGSTGLEIGDEPGTTTSVVRSTSHESGTCMSEVKSTTNNPPTSLSYGPPCASSQILEKLNTEMSDARLAYLMKNTIVQDYYKLCKIPRHPSKAVFEEIDPSADSSTTGLEASSKENGGPEKRDDESSSAKTCNDTAQSNTMSEGQLTVPDSLINTLKRRYNEIESKVMQVANELLQSQEATVNNIPPQLSTPQKGVRMLSPLIMSGPPVINGGDQLSVHPTESKSPRPASPVPFATENYPQFVSRTDNNGGVSSDGGGPYPTIIDRRSVANFQKMVHCGILPIKEAVSVVGCPVSPPQVSPLTITSCHGFVDQVGFNHFIPSPSNTDNTTVGTTANPPPPAVVVPVTPPAVIVPENDITCTPKNVTTVYPMDFMLSLKERTAALPLAENLLVIKKEIDNCMKNVSSPTLGPSADPYSSSSGRLSSTGNYHHINPSHLPPPPNYPQPDSLERSHGDYYMDSGMMGKIRRRPSQYSMQQGYHSQNGNDDAGPNSPYLWRVEKQPFTYPIRQDMSDKRSFAPLTGPMTEAWLKRPPKSLEREALSLMNKLTVENFETIATQLGDTLRKAKCREDILNIVDVVYNKSVMEPRFSELYADLIIFLITCSPEFERDVSTDKPGDFRFYLLQKVQLEYNKLAQTSSLKLLPEQIEGLQESDIEALRKKIKTKTLGTMRLIGELSTRRILPTAALEATSALLLQCNQQLGSGNEEHLLECVCELFATIGYSLESSVTGRQLLDSAVRELTRLMESNKLSQRIEFKINDLIELRNRGWKQNAILREKAQALEDLRREHELDLAHGGEIIVIQEGHEEVVGSQSQYPYKPFVQSAYNMYKEKRKQRKQQQQQQQMSTTTNKKTADSDQQQPQDTTTEKRDEDTSTRVAVLLETTESGSSVAAQPPGTTEFITTDWLNSVLEQVHSNITREFVVQRTRQSPSSSETDSSPSPLYDQDSSAPWTKHVDHIVSSCVADGSCIALWTYYHDNADSFDHASLMEFVFVVTTKMIEEVVLDESDPRGHFIPEKVATALSPKASGVPTLFNCLVPAKILSLIVQHLFLLAEDYLMDKPTLPLCVARFLVFVFKLILMDTAPNLGGKPPRHDFRNTFTVPNIKEETRNEISKWLTSEFSSNIVRGNTEFFLTTEDFMCLD